MALNMKIMWTNKVLGLIEGVVLCVYYHHHGHGYASPKKFGGKHYSLDRYLELVVTTYGLIMLPFLLYGRVLPQEPANGCSRCVP